MSSSSMSKVVVAVVMVCGNGLVFNMRSLDRMVSLPLYAIVASVGVCHDEWAALRWAGTIRRMPIYGGTTTVFHSQIAT